MVRARDCAGGFVRLLRATRWPMSDDDATIRRRNRAKLVGIFSIAVLPLLGAYALYAFMRGGHPWATTNQGELLEPLRSASALRVVDNKGELPSLSGSWWI